MPSRPNTRYTREALSLLGKEIAFARKSKKMTAATLSERCGISRVTLRKIERGDPTTEIGIVFEAAAIVGVRLFDAENTQSLHSSYAHTAEKIALLPKSVRLKTKKTENKRRNDDF
jgi:transcriptional regulator with XRE-family HTH domain